MPVILYLVYISKQHHYMTSVIGGEGGGAGGESSRNTSKAHAACSLTHIFVDRSASSSHTRMIECMVVDMTACRHHLTSQEYYCCATSHLLLRCRNRTRYWTGLQQYGSKWVCQGVYQYGVKPTSFSIIRSNTHNFSVLCCCKWCSSK